MPTNNYIVQQNYTIYPNMVQSSVNVNTTVYGAGNSLLTHVFLHVSSYTYSATCLLYNPFDTPLNIHSLDTPTHTPTVGTCCLIEL